MNIGTMVGKPSDSRKFTPSDELVDSTCYVGVEVEVEHIKSPDDVDLWSIKEDGSLRNHGVEYTFTNPMLGDDIVRAVIALYSSINANNKPNFSDRCGLHIHIDVRSLTPEQYYSYVYHTLLVERTLYRYCGGNRENSVFCIPYYKAEHALGVLSPEHNPAKAIREFSKYSGINLAATGAYGSIEFRMHPGTDSAERVLDWINILLAIRKHAKENCHNDFLRAVSNAGIDNYAASMFKATPSILKYTSKDDLYDGLRRVQGIVERNNIDQAVNQLPKKLGQRSLINKYLATIGKGKEAPKPKNTLLKEPRALKHPIDPIGGFANVNVVERVRQDRELIEGALRPGEVQWRILDVGQVEREIL